MVLLFDRILQNMLIPGERIDIWRASRTYGRHVPEFITKAGVYVDRQKGRNHQVIHFTPGHYNRELQTGIVSVDKIINSSVAAQSECSCLDSFKSYGELRRYAYRAGRAWFLLHHGGSCSGVASEHNGKVVRRPKHLLKEGFLACNLFRINCDDFARYCSTSLDSAGTTRSGKTAAVTGAPILHVTGFVGGLVIGVRVVTPATLTVSWTSVTVTFFLVRCITEGGHGRSKIAAAKRLTRYKSLNRSIVRGLALIARHDEERKPTMQGYFKSLRQ